MTDRPRVAAGSHPLRHSILQAITAGEGRTAEEIARAVYAPAEMVRAHLDVMLDAGFVVAADGGTFELGDIAMSWSWERPTEIASHANAKFEAARVRYERAVYRNGAAVEADEEPGPLSVATPNFVTTRAEIKELQRDIADLVARYEARATDALAAGGDARRLRFMYAVFDEPLPDVNDRG